MGILIHIQHSRKVNVWAGIGDNKVWEPLFFNGALNDEIDFYIFSNFNLISSLTVVFPSDDDPDIPSNNIWHQQNRILRQYPLSGRE